MMLFSHVKLKIKVNDISFSDKYTYDKIIFNNASILYVSNIAQFEK